MGNQNSFQSHVDIVDLNTNYTFETKYTDSRFGEIKLLKRRETGEKIYQKDFTSNSIKEFEEYANKIKRRVVLIHPNLLQILGFNSKKDDMFCADFYRISLFFESFETDLEKEIFKRNSTKNYFSETELRCLLDSVIASCAFLEKNQISHGDIRPFIILITKNREYKVCDSQLFQSIYNPAYFGLLDGLEAKTHYPSPQVFQNYRNKSSKNMEFNPYKNDVYGLGMSVLIAARLEPIDDAYDYNNKRVRQEVVDHALENLKERYSEGFVEALRVLISFDEAQRPTFLELDDEIKAYRADIRAKANLERTLEAQRSRYGGGVGEREVRSRPGAVADVRPNPNPNYTATPHIVDEGLERRVRQAVEKTESTINRASPSKLRNEPLDNYIHSYIKREPVQNEYPILRDVAPHLKMDSRFVPTLKVYSNESNVNVRNQQYQDNNRQYASNDAYGNRTGQPLQYQDGNRAYGAGYQQNSTSTAYNNNLRSNQNTPYGNPPGSGYGYGGNQYSSENYSNGSESRINNIRNYA